MTRFTRRSAFASLGILALVACGQAGSDSPTKPATSNGGAGQSAIQDNILGSADAPITIVEYASWTCSACLQFHRDVIPTLKSEYVDTGKVRFVFREFPTAPANITVAGFALARCAGPDKYYDVVDELFDRQPGILSMARQGSQVRAALMQVAENHGISGEEAFDTCLQDSDIRRAISTSIARGDAAGVNHTPTVFMNGVELPGHDWRLADGMRAVLDAELAKVAPEMLTDAPTDESGDSVDEVDSGDTAETPATE